MTTQHDKPKRWRPRSSVRTLVATLVCLFFGCWLLTARSGVKDVVAHVKAVSPPLQVHYVIFATIENQSAVLPFVVLVDQWHGTPAEPFKTQRQCYFWFFGYVAKLPYERELEPAADFLSLPRAQFN